MPGFPARIRAAGLPHAGFCFRHGSGFGTRICAGSYAARAGVSSFSYAALSGSAATRHHTREHRTSMPVACAFPACACRCDHALEQRPTRGVRTACAESTTHDAELDAAHATSCRGTPTHSASAS